MTRDVIGTHPDKEKCFFILAYHVVFLLIKRYIAPQQKCRASIERIALMSVQARQAFDEVHCGDEKKQLSQCGQLLQTVMPNGCR